MALLGNCALNMILTNAYDLTAGLFSSEDFYLFSVGANKFYTKVGASAFGVMCAIFYWDILAYRKLETDEDK